MKRIRFSLRTLLMLAAISAIACVPLYSQLRSNVALGHLQRIGASPVYIRTTDGISTPYLGSTKPFETWHETFRAACLGRGTVDDLDLIVFTGEQIGVEQFRNALPDIRRVHGVNRIQLLDTSITRLEALEILARDGLSHFLVEE